MDKNPAFQLNARRDVDEKTEIPEAVVQRFKFSRRLTASMALQMVPNERWILHSRFFQRENKNRLRFQNARHIPDAKRFIIDRHNHVE